MVLFAGGRSLRLGESELGKGRACRAPATLLLSFQLLMWVARWSWQGEKLWYRKAQRPRD